MFRCLEVTSRNDFECFTNVDNQASRFVRYVDPLIILPDLKTRDWHREEECCQSEIGVTVHLESFCGFLGRFFDRTEDGVTEVAFSRC